MDTGFGYKYVGALPPSEWPRNFDGENFIDTVGGPGHNAVEEPHMGGDYWLAATSSDPKDWYPESEESSRVFPDMQWNDYAWCGALMCDYTSEDNVYPPDGDFAMGVPMTPDR